MKRLTICKPSLLQLRASCTLACLLTILTVQAAAQQTVAVENTPNRETTAAPVAGEARNIAVETSSEAYEMKLPRADAALLEQKYAAVLRLKAERRSYLPDRKYISDELMSRFWVKSMLIIPTPPTVADYKRTFAQFFNTLAGDLPKDLQLTEEQQRFFQTKADEGYVSIQFPGGAVNISRSGPINIEHEIVVIAIDEETAAARAQAVLNMLDYGIFLPLQREIAGHVQAEVDKLKGLGEEQARQEQIIADVKQEIEDADTISHEALSDLENQRRLLAVDLAGVEARIAACAEILARLDRGKVTRIEQVENIKISAEIELAGLAARRKSLDAIISKAHGFVELDEKLQGARKKAAFLSSERRRHEASIDWVREMATYLAPSKVVADKIVVHPIKWTNE